MIKRSFYIILSSLIAASATWMWTQNSHEIQADTPQNADAPKVADTPVHPEAAPEPVQPEPVQPEPVVETVELPEKELLNYHEVILSYLQADDTIMSAELQVLATEDAIRQPLIPALDENERQTQITNAFIVLANSQALNSATSKALVDLKTSTIHAADLPEKAKQILQKLKEANADSIATGTTHLLGNTAPTRVSWHCLNEDHTYCILVQTPIKVDLPEHIRCQAAHNVFVSCKHGSFNTGALFDAKSCNESAQPSKTVLTKLQSQTGPQGNFEIEDTTYEFKKLVSDESFSVTTVAPVMRKVVIAPPPVEPQPEPQIPAPVIAEPVQPEPSSTDTVKAWSPAQSFGLAGGAFALMALLGWLCVRRREEDEKTSALKEECEKSASEKEEMQRQLQDNEKRSAEYTEKIQDLEEQLDKAQKAYQKEQIIRLSLEEENKRLEDSLVSHKKAENTAVESVSHFATEANPADVPSAYQSAPKLSPVSEKTSEKDDSKKDGHKKNSHKGKHKKGGNKNGNKGDEQLKAIDNDVWDDIEDSFDAIFVPSRAKTPSVETQKDAPLDSGIIANEPIKDGQSLGISTFINAIKDSETRIQPMPETESSPSINTDTRHKPVMTTPNPEQTAVVPNAVQGQAGTPNASGKTGRQITENQIQAAKTEVKQSLDPSNEVFQPAPSWTEQQSTHAGMDQNALYDALKRRAKDISEMAMPAVKGTLNKSGAFDFSVGLSKSGVFSVTGSRVDIDPLSDTEYFKSLYEKYIDLQNQCGETTNKFTLEQFVSRLAREKERLIKTHKCRTVRFNVYIKDGKASLKATPQK